MKPPQRRKILNLCHLLAGHLMPGPSAEGERGLEFHAQPLYHKAAGHPSNKNLHLFHGAGLPKWKIDMAKNFTCPACQSLKRGGTGSGNIPPAATHPAYRAWQAVGRDSAEWLPPESRKNIRFIFFTDLATKLKAVHIVAEYGCLEVRIENTGPSVRGGSVIRLAQRSWCNAKRFLSDEMHRCCSRVGILLAPPAEKEAWAHGLVESAIKDLKMTASAIQLGQPDLDPTITLMLAAAALNSTEYTKGYSFFSVVLCEKLRDLR